MRGLYIVQTREFVRLGEPVYKTGRTDDWLLRIKNYPKGSELVYFQQWRIAGHDSLVAAETALLHALRSHPDVLERRDIGAEYFQADPDLLTALVHDRITQQRQLAQSGSASAEPGPAAPALRTLSVAVDPDIAVLDFVKLNKSALAGSSVCSSELYERFVAHLTARGERGNLHHTGFTRKVIAATGASSVVVRNGLLVERCLCFPSLDAPPIVVVQEASYVQRFLALRPGDRESDTGNGERVYVTKDPNVAMSIDLLQDSFLAFMNKHHAKVRTTEKIDLLSMGASGYSTETRKNTCKACWRVTLGRSRCCEKFDARKRSRVAVVWGLSLVREPAHATKLPSTLLT